MPVVLYGPKTRSATSTEEHRLRVFKNRVLINIFGPKVQKGRENEENYIIRNSMNFTLHKILLG